VTKYLREIKVGKVYFGSHFQRFQTMAGGTIAFGSVEKKCKPERKKVFFIGTLLQ
jgi:hypothetical protein